MDNLNHILVVDDDNRIRALLKEYLNENKFLVSTAQNSDEAKIKLDHFKFDLIVGCNDAESDGFDQRD